MGIYLNPGNEGFRSIRNSCYVDKTGLIEYTNSTINAIPEKLTCFSRSRRFGKSFAAKMLCAYYGKDCDSHSLFDDLKISGSDTYEEHLNQYDVIYLDITWFISTTKNVKEVVKDLQNSVIKELKEAYTDFVDEKEVSLPRSLSNVAKKTGHKFIIIIDEWDALFREAKRDVALQDEYIQLLRGLFKGGTTTDETIAAAYLTGILPIKKYGTESALTDFQEFTMIDADILSQYIGFTESEVRELCVQNSMDFEEMKCWYDGYVYKDVGSIYNPNSVMSAIRRKRFRSYWTASETYESLKSYIIQNFDGLKDAIILMLGGQHVSVDTSTFQNDLTSFANKDDVLTLLIHLGYLTYDEKGEQVYIPNLEVAGAFKSAVKGTEWKEVNMSLQQSNDLLRATFSRR